MRYENLSAKLPFITKLNVLCEQLDMSLTETQLPMFCRLLELCMALYYGTLELPETSVTQSEQIDRFVTDGQFDSAVQGNFWQFCVFLVWC
jgi:hypothetical protein